MAAISNMADPLFQDFHFFMIFCDPACWKYEKTILKHASHQ